MPQTKLEKVAIGTSLGALLGGFVAALIATQPPLRLPQNQTSKGFNDANLGTAVEAGLSIGAATGAIIALA